MKRLTLLSLIIFIGTVCTIAQKHDETLITIGSEKVSVEEFERFYLKNNRMVNEVDRKSLDEYLDLFTIYKLKVAEAKSNGLDQAEDFKRELESYREQLMQPFMVDTLAEQRIIEETYERMQSEVNASHILIAVASNASPQDTLYQYNKALQIRERILKGEPFNSVARATSDDPSVNQNNGDLGYFTAFQMVYPFEKAVFALDVDSLSQPIRSKFGYHIIKLNDRRPAKGQLRVAHIMFVTPTNAGDDVKAKAKERADSVYQLVLSNHDFNELAKKYSEDRGSAKNGGVLQWFGSGRMVPEFETAAFALAKIGDVSQPIQTQFGWHIIKLLERKTVGSLQEELPDMRMRISRDERGKVGQKVFVENKKKEFGFKLDSKALETFKTLVDSSLYKGEWALNPKFEHTTLFTLNNKVFTLGDIARDIQEGGEVPQNRPLYEFAESTYKNFVEHTVLAMAEQDLMQNNKDFYFLYREYYDGILLFDIMDKEVWTKASNDREAIANFYEENIHLYSWEERVHLKKYKAPNEKIYKKAHKLILSKKGPGLTDEAFLAKVNKGSKTPLTLESLAVNSNSQLVKNYKSWEKGISPAVKEGEAFTFMREIKTVANEPKPLKEVRGQVIADYQEYLEKQWLETLRSKHKITINEKLYNQLVSKLN